MTKNSKLSSVDNVPSHHSGAQGRDVAGCKRSGAVAKAGRLCSWLRPGSSCPWGAVNWRIMLASLIGWHCATASGPWRCASGPPVSAGPGSGFRHPPSHWGWSSSSSVCLHCALCTCVCQCTGGGGGSQQHSLEDPRIIAFGGGGGGIGGGSGSGTLGYEAALAL